MGQKRPMYPASTLAKLFNLSERRIRQLAQEGIIPKKEKGQYDVVASVQGYLKYLQEQVAGRGLTTAAIHVQRLRRIEALADEKELSVSQQLGALINVHTAVERGGRKVMATKTGLLALADRITQMLGLSLMQRHGIQGAIKKNLFAQSDYVEEDNDTRPPDE